jgi:hypothetical protein
MTRIAFRDGTVPHRLSRNLDALQKAGQDAPMAAILDKLKEWSATSLFTAKGDEICSAKKYYANGLDGLLAGITKAAIADGTDRQTLMKLFLRHADEVSNG